MAILICVKYPAFAKRFREACTDAGAPDTQVSLGKFLGVSGTMAWYYRNGEKLPAMKTAIEFAEKLNVSVEWLLTGNGNKKPGHQKKTGFSDRADREDLIDMIEQELKREGRNGDLSKALRQILKK